MFSTQLARTKYFIAHARVWVRGCKRQSRVHYATESPYECTFNKTREQAKYVLNDLVLSHDQLLHGLTGKKIL